MKKLSSEVVVVGGGAAGLMCACTAAERGRRVLLVEKNKRIGRKLAITGKGRCNITNNCSVDEVIKNTLSNPKFLYSSLSSFPPSELMAFFENKGLKLKTERGGRVFPMSDKAFDVLDVFSKTLSELGVKVIPEQALKAHVSDGCISGLSTDKSEIGCKALVLATGGLSYPLTGSTGEGHKIVGELGHTITELRPSLVPLVEQGSDCSRMQGLSLKNVTLTLLDERKKAVFKDFGELLFTHFGLSGPLALSASAKIKSTKVTGYRALIDLKPALDESALDKRLLRDFEKYSNREFSNTLSDLLPRLIIPLIVERSEIPPDMRVHSLTKQMRLNLGRLIKGFDVDIEGTRPIEEAIVTAGGVDIKEVSPLSMESKLVKGLYLAGEVLDLDAYTGGYNLQIAWSTGRAAGKAV